MLSHRENLVLCWKKCGLFIKIFYLVRVLLLKNAIS